MSEMVDDRDGLYSHASEAVEAGRFMGRIEAAQAIRAAIAPYYCECERLDDPAKFHAVGEALRLAREAMEKFDKPRAAV